MTRYASTLPPTKINPKHHQALQQLADKLQTSTSQLTRQAIAKFLAEQGFDFSKDFQAGAKAD